MNGRTTHDRLLERYNTYTRRVTILDQRTMIYKSLRRTLGPWLPRDRRARVLDVACGEGSLLAFLRDEGYQNLSGFDLSPENVSFCHRLGLTFVQQHDALRLSEFSPSDRYEMIVALDLIEHVPKEAAAGLVEQMRDRLCPGGTLMLQTPNMGCVFGLFHRYGDLSHEFSLTERTAVDLLMLAGFAEADIQVHPAWSATTLLGLLREVYLRALHRFIFLSEDSGRPKVATKNLLLLARRP